MGTSWISRKGGISRKRGVYLEKGGYNPPYQLWDISVPYMPIFERITNFLTVPPISLDGTAETDSSSELITETALQAKLITETDYRL